MCLYQPQHVNIKCGHAECQIIQTIKKLNRDVFRRAGGSNAPYRGEDGESEEDGLRELGGEGNQEAQKGLSSKRTIHSLTELELVERVAALERELRELTQVTLAMKQKLEQYGII